MCVEIWYLKTDIQMWHLELLDVKQSDKVAHIQIFIGCFYPETPLRDRDGGRERGVSGSLHACTERVLI